MWADHQEFENIIQGIWQAQIAGTLQFQIATKLKSIKAALRSLNRSHFLNIPAKSKEAKDRLLDFQRQLDLRPADEALRVQERMALQDYILLSKQEESFYAQKSRIRWLKEGNLNTAFFHSSVRSRFNRNKLASLTLDDGSRIYDPDHIKSAAVRHFSSIMNGPMPNYPGKNRLSPFINKFLTLDQASSLSAPISASEVQRAMFSIDPDKAPGPDGFNGFFFRKVWHIVG